MEGLTLGRRLGLGLMRPESATVYRFRGVGLGVWFLGEPTTEERPDVMPEGDAPLEGTARGEFVVDEREGG